MSKRKDRDGPGRNIEGARPLKKSPLDQPKTLTGDDVESLDLGPEWEDPSQWILALRQLKESSAGPPGPSPGASPSGLPASETSLPPPRKASGTPGPADKLARTIAHKIGEKTASSRDSQHLTIQQGLERMPEETLVTLASDLARLIASQWTAVEPANEPDNAAPSRAAAAHRTPATAASQQSLTSLAQARTRSKTGAFVSMDEVLSRIQNVYDQDWAVAGSNPERNRGAAGSGFRRYLHEVPGGSTFVDSAGRWKTPAILRAVALLTAGLAFAIGILAVSSYLVSEHNAAQARARSAETKPLEIVQRNAVNSVLQGYFNATGWEERLRWVRSPELVQPKMRAWYSRHTDPGPLEIQKVGTLVTANYGGIRCVVAGVLLKGQIQETPVILEWRHDRFYWIDWETLAAYQDRPPEELFAAPEPVESDLRCVLTPSDYYNGEFSDPARWKCYSLDYPGNDEGFFGYVARGSGVEGDLDHAIQRRKNLGALLRVRTLPAASGFRQLEIVELRENSWIPQYESEADS
ncbi:MAG TPA: hypothetical protein VMN36_16625 [Verrucomicrobiales bacterium]|nr:hypothetical protein [Verrucomicrobiales bacterium]